MEGVGDKCDVVACKGVVSVLAQQVGEPCTFAVDGSAVEGLSGLNDALQRVGDDNGFNIGVGTHQRQRVDEIYLTRSDSVCKVDLPAVNSGVYGHIGVEVAFVDHGLPQLSLGSEGKGWGEYGGRLTEVAQPSVDTTCRVVTRQVVGVKPEREKSERAGIGMLANIPF